MDPEQQRRVRTHVDALTNAVLHKIGPTEFFNDPDVREHARIRGQGSYGLVYELPIGILFRSIDDARTAMSREPSFLRDAPPLSTLLSSDRLPALSAAVKVMLLKGPKQLDGLHELIIAAIVHEFVISKCRSPHTCAVFNTVAKHIAPPGFMGFELPVPCVSMAMPFYTQRLASWEPPSFEALCMVFMQLTFDVVARARFAFMEHRDLRPANIMFARAPPASVFTYRVHEHLRLFANTAVLHNGAYVVAIDFSLSTLSLGANETIGSNDIMQQRKSTADVVVDDDDARVSEFERVYDTIGRHTRTPASMSSCVGDVFWLRYMIELALGANTDARDGTLCYDRATPQEREMLWDLHAATARAIRSGNAARLLDHRIFAPFRVPPPVACRGAARVYEFSLLD